MNALLKIEFQGHSVREERGHWIKMMTSRVPIERIPLSIFQQLVSHHGAVSIECFEKWALTFLEEPFDGAV